MAMLQLVRTLSNVSVRLTPRVSWWVTAQHLLSASSMAINPNPSETVRDSKVEKDETRKPQHSEKRVIEDRSLITAAFKSLLNTSDGNISEESRQLNEKINAANDVEEVLSTSENPMFNEQNANIAVQVLCNWVAIGKIKMTDIQNDKRYWKICQMMGLKKQPQSPTLMKREGENEKYSSSLYGVLQTEKAKKQIERLNVFEMVTVLTALAHTQKRSTPLLRILATKIATSEDKLNIKQLGDILYSMSVLTFYDEALIQKISKDLLKVIPKNKRPAVIGSILTSLGFMRYRDESLLNVLSSWILEHQDIIRPQEINSLLMTLAHLGYSPTNFDEVTRHIISPLKESDMCQSSEWLDLVWALTILDRATSKHYESVLNEDYLNRLCGISKLSASRALKLLNVNAAARLFMPHYKGSLLPENSEVLSTSIIRSKDKIELSNSIASALKILLPSDPSYLNIHVNTKMGFLLDAEFCVDNKCTPVPFTSKSEKDNQVFRIGVLTTSYHEYCRGKADIIGPIKLSKKLLESQGYKVLLIPYKDVNIRDKLVTRVKYINDNIKVLVEQITAK